MIWEKGNIILLNCVKIIPGRHGMKIYTQKRNITKNIYAIYDLEEENGSYGMTITEYNEKINQVTKRTVKAFTTDKEKAKVIYDKICKGRACAVHLADIIENLVWRFNEDKLKIYQI